MDSNALDRAHAVLRKALREVPEEHRPPPPWHVDGPLLTCPALDQIRVSQWCAELLRERAPEDQRGTVDRVLAEVARFLAAPPDLKSEGSDRRLHHGLETLGEVQKGECASLVAARRAASGAATYARGKADLVFSSAAVAVSRTAKELVDDPRPISARVFLSTLDEKLMLYELASAFRERLHREPPPFAHVLFRAGDEKGKMSFWIARLASGTHGLLGRLGPGARPRWAFVEGSRDEVLASVPDPLFAAATARVVA